jgi:hypothetical protein
VAKVGEIEEIHRYRTYSTLGQLDAARLNALLEKHPVTHEGVKFAMHQMAGRALGHENLEAAQAYIATIKDPLYRSNTLVNLFDDRTGDHRERKLALLRQAWQEGKQAAKPEQLVAIRAMIARRLWAMGEKAEATQLLRDGHEMARELPAGDWPNMARGSFAQSLGLVDLPAALELLQPLQGGDDHERFHRLLARAVAATDPAGAERIVEMLQHPPQNRTSLVMQLCYPMPRRICPAPASWRTSTQHATG